MTDSKHTPGPWKIVRRMGWDFQGIDEQASGECKMGFVGPAGERICWFGNSETYYPTEGDEPSEADACLIAAAPDLLETLKELVDVLRKEAPGTPLNNHRFDMLGAKAYAAIAKAEGKA